jgi:hypothetical protein
VVTDEKPEQGGQVNPETLADLWEAEIKVRERLERIRLSQV